MGMYYCPNCNADLEEQPGFDPSNGTWTCTECGQFLTDPDIPDGDTYPGVTWFCDNCNALLNRQSGFSDSYGTWTCTECGHTNSISDEDIIEDTHKCPSCGANLKKQWDYSEYTNDYTCAECGSALHRDYSSDEFSVIADEDKCPNCGAYLKSQWGFSTYDDDWTCTECNAELHREYSSDPFSTVEDEHKCPNCGTSLLKQSGYSEYSNDWTCSECNSKLHRDYSSSEFSIVESDDSDSDYNDNDVDSNEYMSYSGSSNSGYSSPPPSFNYGGRSTSSSGGYTRPSSNSSSTSNPRSNNRSPKVKPKNTYNYSSHYAETRKNPKRILLYVGISFLVMLTILIVVYFIIRNKTTVPVTDLTSINTAVNKDIFISEITKLGMKNIKCVELNDLMIYPDDKENVVDHVEYEDVNIKEESRIKKETPVTIFYHSLNKDYKVLAPIEASEFKLMELDSAKEMLTAAGFTNVTTEILELLNIGNLDNIGKVKEIKIDDKSDYIKGEEFSHESEVIIYALDYNIASKAKIPKSSADYIGTKSSIILDDLEQAGFINFECIEEKDITNDNYFAPNTVKSISIGDSLEFNKDDMFPRDIKIIVTIHKFSDDCQIAIPKKASKYEGKNYKDVTKELEEIGFCDIELSIEHDINWVNILPFTASDGDVKSISINGQTDFEEGDKFLWTSKVKIVYHSK